MTPPESIRPGEESVQTGATVEGFHVSPVSHLWLGRLVEIDSSWNPRSWSVRLFERELSSVTSRVRGLFLGSELIGYLIAHVVCDEGHIVSFGLAPEWRGKGGGAYLLKDFLRAAGVEGVRAVSLDVRVSNLRARALYERHGFITAGIRKRYYSDNGEDAITMRLEGVPVPGKSSGPR